MSIVKMNRLRLIGLESQRSDLLARLQHAGCVEVLEPTGALNDPDWTELLHRDTSSLLEVKAQATVIKSALEALKKYAGEKSGLFVKRVPVRERDFLRPEALAQALEVAETIDGQVRQLSRLQTRQTNQENARNSLLPWQSLDLDLATQETASAFVELGTCPLAVDLAALEGELAQAAPQAALYEVSQDKHQRYLLFVCHKEDRENGIKCLRPHGYGAARLKGFTGTPAENLNRIAGELEQIEADRAQCIQTIQSLAGRRKELEIAQDRVDQELQKQQAREKLLTDGTMFFLEGWVAQTGWQALEQELEGFSCAWEIAEPGPEDTPPTLLKNRKWLSCISMVTEMYSLPVYRGGIDPNPLIYIFFVIFFGFMFADLAYGLILLAICLVVVKKFDPKGTMGYMFHLGQHLGVSTAIFGALTGGCFGDAIYQFTSAFFPDHVISMPALISPLEDPMTIMAIALGMGVIHMVFGQCIHIYMEIRDGHPAEGFLDVVPWWIVFIGLAVAYFTGNPWVIVAGFLALLLTQGRHKKGILGKLFGGIASWYDITSWLGDILSYCRLMALMLATAVISQVFNILATLPAGGLPKPVGVLLFLVIFFIGNAFNMGINIIGTYVHAARLQYLEFFSKFYKEGGIPFQPLKYKTKYVDVTTDNGEVVE